METSGYIGFSKDYSAKVEQHRVLAETFPSGYRAIWAEISTNQRPARNNKSKD